MLRSVLTIEGQ